MADTDEAGERPVPAPRLERLGRRSADRVAFTIDGEPAEGLEGDTLLTALLTNRSDLGALGPDPRRRAGFCLMGICQDCWVRLADGRRVRACTTRLEPGMAVLLEAGEVRW